MLMITLGLEELTYTSKARRQSQRQSNPPVRFSPGTTDMIALQVRKGDEKDDTPVTFSEAISGKRGKNGNWQWRGNQRIE